MSRIKAISMGVVTYIVGGVVVVMIGALIFASLFEIGDEYLRTYEDLVSIVLMLFVVMFAGYVTAIVEAATEGTESLWTDLLYDALIFPLALAGYKINSRER